MSLRRTGKDSLMYLSKRSNGVYYLYFENKNGSLSSKSTKCRNKTDAIKFLHSFKIEYEEKIQNRIRLTQFRIDYLKHSEKFHSINTYNYLKYLFNDLVEYFGNIFLDEIDSNSIRNYLYNKTKVSTYTAQKYLAHLRKAFQFANDCGNIKLNPLQKFENFKIPERQPLFLSKQDFKKLCKEIYLKKHFHYLDLVIFATYTGLRASEIINLQWNQILFEHKLILLDNQSSITKTKKVRAIPLNKKAFAVLKRKDKNSQFVFTLNGEKLKLDYVSKRFKKFIISSKLNKKYKFHSLRHTFASWLVQKDVPIQKVSKLLGHSDIKTTQIYAHLRTEDLIKAVNSL